MIDLVLDIEKYPEFVPFCFDAKIHENKNVGDLSKIIASNKNLLKFINWTPKHNKIEKMVKSCLTWEKKISNSRNV